MRRLLDNLLCIVVTIAMFAFPVLLLGLAPWFGDSLIGGLHIHFGTSVFEIFKSVFLMMSSAGGALLLAVPLFALAWFALTRASRFTTWFLSSGQLVNRMVTAGADDEVPVAPRPGNLANPERSDGDAVDRGRRVRTAFEARRSPSSPKRRRN